MIAFKVESEQQQEDGRWLAEAVKVPGVLGYGERQEAALLEAMPGKGQWKRSIGASELSRGRGLGMAI